MRKHIIKLLIPLLIAGNAYAATASDRQSLEQIKLVTQAFLQDKLTPPANTRAEISIGNLDPRLRLLQCTHKLRTFLPPGSRANNASIIGVSCMTPKPWSIYVPVRVKLFTKVLVANNSLNKGTIIRKHDIILVEKDLNRLNQSFFTKAGQVVGKMTRRAIRPGVIITAPALKPAVVVRRGQSVSINATNGNIRVEMHGIALMNGGQGHRIKVRNRGSKKVIEAVVMGPGKVGISL